jgi:PAS domain S-box-containing protein
MLLRRQVALPLLVLLAALSFVAVACWSLNRHKQQLLQDDFDAGVLRLSAELEARFELPFAALRGTRALFHAREGVSEAEFQAYVDSLGMLNDFAGMYTVSYVQRVSAPQVASLEQAARRQGHPGFVVRPVTSGGADRYVVRYVTPLSSNGAALGYDLASDEQRRGTLLRAVRTGQPTLSPVISMVQDQHQRSAVLYMLPIYRQGQATGTIAQREAAVTGLVSGGVLIDEVLQGQVDILKTVELDYQLRADVGSQGMQLLYDSRSGAARAQSGAAAAGPRLDGPTAPSARFTREILLPVGGLDFRLQVFSRPSFESRAQHLELLALAVIGACLSLVLAGWVWVLASGRALVQRQVLEMSEEMQRLAAVARSSSNPVVITDRAFLITWVNHGFTRLTGFDSGQALGQSLPVLLKSDGRDPVTQRQLEEAIRKGSGCRIQTINERLDGSAFWLDSDVQPIRNARDEVTGFIVIGLDISSQRRIQQQLGQALERAAARSVEMARLARVARFTANAVIVSDVNRQIVWVNDAFVRLFGLALGDVAGHDLLGLFDQPDVNQQALMLLRASHAIEDSFVFETHWQRGDGVTLALNVEFRPQLEDDGSLAGFMVLALDVSERKQAEQALLQAHRETDQLSSAIQTYAIVSVADRGGRIIDVNEAFTRISGYARHELLGHNHRIVKSGEQAADFWPQVWATISSGQSWRGEVCNRAKDGHLYWMDTQIVPFTNGDGVIEKYISIRLDITERKAAERALQLSHERFNLAADAAGVGVWDYDLATRQWHGDARTRRVLGQPLQALETSDALFQQMVAPADQRLFGRQVRQALLWGGRLECDLQLRWPDGSQHYITLVGLAARGATGQVTGLTGVIYDTTARHKAQLELMEARDQAEQASVAKSLFLATMSHEIRTPMNAILGMLSLLQRTPLTEVQSDYVGMTEGAARSLLNLLNAILDFSKIEADGLQLNCEPFEVDAMLRDVSVVLAANLGAKPIELLFEIEPEALTWLVGDALRLKQVLINLAGNAVKFTERGEVVIALRCTARDEARLTLQFSVTDTGIGIAAEHQAKLFTAFTQAEPSTTRRYGGTGLGLVISSRLVALMGGQLSLHSEAGQGSCFSFSIDLERAPVPQAPALEADPQPAPARVLIVDDHAHVRQVMLADAHCLGWPAEAVATGAEALQRLNLWREQGQPADLVLLDWKMPDMDGWDTLRALDTLYVDGGARPLVLMVTAHDRDMLMPAASDGLPLMDGYLVKPITPGMLAEVVQRARRQRRADAHPRLRQSPLEPRLPRLPGLRILLVEDNPVNQRVARELLQAEGAQVTLASQGREGVDCLLRSLVDGPLFDLVLMDLQMPVMDGLQATRLIREQPGLQTLPVIAMTANAMAEDRQQCLSVGMNDHLGKPFHIDQLVALVQRWVPQARGEVESPAGVADKVAEPPSASDTDLPVLNEADALQRLGGDHELLDMLCPLLAEELPGVCASWHALVDAGQWEAAADCVHGLKGSAGAVGADRLAAVAAQVERACRQAPQSPLEPHWAARLQAAVLATEQALAERGL